MTDTIAPPRASLKQLFRQQQKQDFQQRTHTFSTYSDAMKRQGESLFHRQVLSPAERLVRVASDFEPEVRDMLMFGSNNYLGFANHAYIKDQVTRAIQQYGTGTGGPPLLNGNHYLLTELERRLAAFKGYEDALVFPSGYATNLGLFSGLPLRKDLVLVDEKHHASCFDGLKLKKIPYTTFAHNDATALQTKLDSLPIEEGASRFIAVEGVYSMQGSLAVLPAVLELANRHDAILLLDDAHATGVLGQNGRGTMSHFQLKSNARCLSMGTFSKTFAVTGGFVCGTHEVIEYLRYFARSYMFSGSLSPILCAAVIAALDLLEQEPEHQQRLLENCRYAVKCLRQIGLDVHMDAAILALPLRPGMVVNKVAMDFHRHNVFVNTIEYPAVEEGKECVRISFSAMHHKEDIDRLVEVINTLWFRGNE